MTEFIIYFRQTIDSTTFDGTFQGFTVTNENLVKGYCGRTQSDHSGFQVRLFVTKKRSVFYKSSVK